MLVLNKSTSAKKLKMGKIKISFSSGTSNQPDDERISKFVGMNPDLSVVTEIEPIKKEVKSSTEEKSLSKKEKRRLGNRQSEDDK